MSCRLSGPVPCPEGGPEGRRIDKTTNNCGACNSPASERYVTNAAGTSPSHPRGTNSPLTRNLPGTAPRGRRSVERPWVHMRGPHAALGAHRSAAVLPWIERQNPTLPPCMHLPPITTCTHAEAAQAVQAGGARPAPTHPSYSPRILRRHIMWHRSWHPSHRLHARWGRPRHFGWAVILLHPPTQHSLHDVPAKQAGHQEGAVLPKVVRL